MTKTFYRLGAGAVLFLSTSLPALANICPDFSNTAQWIGGAATPLSSSNAMIESTQVAIPQSSQSIVYFELASPSDIRLEAAPIGPSDPSIEIYTAEGTYIGGDDDSGGNLAARVEQSLDTGRYCAVLRNFDSSASTAHVRLALQDQAALTEGLDFASYGGADTFAESCSYDSASIRFDSLPATGAFSANQNPTIGLRLSAPSGLSITAKNQEADPAIALYSADSAQVGYNDDSDGLNARLDFSDPLPAGDYCLHLNALNDGNAAIDVAMTAYDAAGAIKFQVDAGQSAPPLDGSFVISEIGALPARHRLDVQASETASWYAFSVPEGGVVAIEAIAGNISNPADPVIYLYDDFGRYIAENDDNGTNYDSLLVQRLAPGDYLLGLRTLQGPQAPIRLLFERYVPAK